MTEKPLKLTGKMREKFAKGVNGLLLCVYVQAQRANEWHSHHHQRDGKKKKVLIINIWKAFNIFMPFVHDYRVKLLRMLMADKCWMLDEFQFFFAMLQQNTVLFGKTPLMSLQETFREVELKWKYYFFSSAKFCNSRRRRKWEKMFEESLNCRELRS